MDHDAAMHHRGLALSVDGTSGKFDLGRVVASPNLTALVAEVLDNLAPCSCLPAGRFHHPWAVEEAPTRHRLHHLDPSDLLDPLFLDRLPHKAWNAAVGRVPENSPGR